MLSQNEDWEKHEINDDDLGQVYRQRTYLFTVAEELDTVVCQTQNELGGGNFFFQILVLSISTTVCPG